MSARNYTQCPQCLLNMEHAREKQIQRTTALYGVIAAEDFADKMNESKRKTSIGETLAEYYDIGVSQGHFAMRYNCECARCGWGTTQKMSVNVPMRTPE